MKHETNQSLRVTSLHHTKKDKLAKNQKSIETKTVDQSSHHHWLRNRLP